MTEQANGNDFLQTQIVEIRRASVLRIIGMSCVLIISLVLLYLLIYVILNQRISSQADLSEILNTETLSQLETIMVERDIKNTHPEIFDIKTVEKVNSFYSKVTNSEDDDLVKDYLLLDIASYTNYIYVYVYIDGVITTKNINLLYDEFNFNQKIRIDKLKKRIDKETELWDKITNSLNLTIDVEDDTQKAITEISKNRNYVIDIIRNDIVTEDLVATVGSHIRKLAAELKTSTESNDSNYKKTEKKLFIIVNRNLDKVKKIVDESSKINSVAKIIQKSLLSLILVSIIFTFLYLIKNEIVLISKTQSLIILSKGLNFKYENVSLFEAMDRLHTFKGQSREINEVLDILKEVRRR